MNTSERDAILANNFGLRLDSIMKAYGNEGERQEALFAAYNHAACLIEKRSYTLAKYPGFVGMVKGFFESFITFAPATVDESDKYREEVRTFLANWHNWALSRD